MDVKPSKIIPDILASGFTSYIVRYYLSRCQKIQLPSCAVIPAFKLEASKFLVAIETYFPIVSISIIPSFVLNWISVNCHPKTQETSSLLCTPGTLVHGLNETSCGNKGNSIWKSSFNLINKDSRNDWQMKGPSSPYLILPLPPSHSLTPLHRINAGPLPLTNKEIAHDFQSAINRRFTYLRNS